MSTVVILLSVMFPVLDYLEKHDGYNIISCCERTYYHPDTNTCQLYSVKTLDESHYDTKVKTN